MGKGMKASAVAQVTVPVTYKVGNDTLTCHVSPAIYHSDEFRDEMNKITADIREAEAKQEEEIGGVIMKSRFDDYEYAIATVTQSWDYLDDEGKPLPITPENVKEMWFKVELWNEMLAAFLSKKKMGRTVRTG